MDAMISIEIVVLIFLAEDEKVGAVPSFQEWTTLMNCFDLTKNVNWRFFLNDLIADFTLGWRSDPHFSEEMILNWSFLKSRSTLDIIGNM